MRVLRLESFRESLRGLVRGEGLREVPLPEERAAVDLPAQAELSKREQATQARERAQELADAEAVAAAEYANQASARRRQEW